MKKHLNEKRLLEETFAEMINRGEELTIPSEEAVASLCFAKRKTSSPSARKLAEGIEPGGSIRR